MINSYQDTGLPALLSSVVTRAANEGVPVAAIARIVQWPFSNVSDHLQGALACGAVAEMPKPDWPPNARWAERLPSVPRSAHPEDTAFAAKRLFKLTKLESAFLMILLRHDCVEKEKLHAAIEDQRAKRPQRPDKQEITDPKMVDVIICKLRKKLKQVDESFILTTSWGSGYYFEAAVKAAVFHKIGERDAGGPPPERTATPGGPAE